MSPPEPTPGPGLNRRTAIKWMLTAAAAAAWRDRSALGADGLAASPAGLAGYGGDPDLLKEYRPGELWPLIFTAAERRTAGALCDLILPQDETSPSATALHVPDFIDEWISAPYPGHAADRGIVTQGLAWLNQEARKRFGSDFADGPVTQQSAIADDLCYLSTAEPKFETAARFFKKFRDLTMDGFYTTAEGMKDIGYVGNVPSPTFDGPPAEALRRLGLT